MSSWRAAGLNYLQFSTIAAKVVRGALKSTSKVETIRKDAGGVKVVRWIDGKPEKKEFAT